MKGWLIIVFDAKTTINVEADTLKDCTFVTRTLKKRMR